MRCLPALLVAAAFLPRTASAECPWVEPKEAPVFSVARHFGGELKFRADPKWFQCAKKAGGELTVTFEVAEGEGEFTPVVTRQVRSYSARETIGSRDVCKAGPGEKRVRVSMKGTGELAKLAFAADPVAWYCPRCRMASGDNSLVIHTSDRSSLTPKGMFTLQGNVDEKWHACARLGSKLELRLYAGDSRDEVLNAVEPTHVVRGLETSARWKKAFDRRPICKTGAKFLGYELWGSGEMSELNYQGRSVQEIAAQCKT